MSANSATLDRGFTEPDAVDVLYKSRIFKLRLEEMYKKQDYIEKARNLSQKLRQNALERELFSREVLVFKQKLYSDNFLYKIIGVSSKLASKDEIKSNWRKQVVKWHPDKAFEYNKKTCEKILKIINLAHEILTDKDKRYLYDRHGNEWLNRCDYFASCSLNDI
jgi:DnaJ-class molecular chaperone